jgi:hypothetical protein
MSVEAHAKEERARGVNLDDGGGGPRRRWGRTLMAVGEDHDSDGGTCGGGGVV